MIFYSLIFLRAEEQCFNFKPIIHTMRKPAIFSYTLSFQKGLIINGFFLENPLKTSRLFQGSLKLAVNQKLDGYPIEPQERKEPWIFFKNKN